MHEPHLLTLPASPAGPLSIRAKALLFHDSRSVQLLQQVERLAHSDATALIVGETGTGKELIARHIHQVSGRGGPFVAVNCGAFSETLIDAELFGHEAGAFTGASGARSGWFEAANGGTLFLDEVGDLSLPLQVKLLRVLQERQVVRLGSRRPIPLDVRLVAATNVDLHRAVAAQRFRADLYYRLSVAPVALPPLRERPGDILPLARHFLRVHALRMRRPQPVPLTLAAEHALLSYAWPGNIRELENVLHFALIVCPGERIDVADLKLAPIALAADGPTVASAASAARPDLDAAAPLQQPRPEPAAATASAEAGQPPAPDATEQLGTLFQALLASDLPELARTVEATLVRCAFIHCGENQVRTAQRLGISRNSARTLLKRHGLLGEGGADGDAEPVARSDAADDRRQPASASHAGQPDAPRSQVVDPPPDALDDRPLALAATP